MGIVIIFLNITIFRKTCEWILFYNKIKYELVGGLLKC